MVEDLLGFLDRAPDFLVERAADDEIQVSVVSSLHHERLREYLESYLRAWEEAHPGVETQLLD